MASFTAERFLVLCMFISLVLAAPLPVSRDQQQDRSNRSIRNLHARQYDDDGDWNPTATTTAEDEPTDSAPWLWAVTSTASTTTTTTTTQWQQPTASASPHNGRHGNHDDDDDDEEKDYQEEDDDSTTQDIATPTTTSSSSSKSTTMAASSKKSKGGSGGGSYSGKATWYTVSLGSCGSTNSDSELVAAMNHAQMENGANSNNNPNCGRRVSIKGPKGSVTVKVVDTCPSCPYGNIDLSPAAFKRIADLDDGVAPIKWSW
ncbi:hypothetical protein RO3G_05068 [Lichtheimia corymbifera JMRC:FSU:9682]|uniref:RlpA-like protein double-psi beta-barrel domain-containing protein n=1 Tax=Lichtheimia corymbifera JMRC:FSU:9682 TaxID=1263082 RepID=A0A068S2P7_9FUNG|nr:hypothetical protein RO3G_05068 [Lichtheimia corymbifera JMRC:FSU:9682]